MIFGLRTLGKTKEMWRALRIGVVIVIGLDGPFKLLKRAGKVPVLPSNHDMEPDVVLREIAELH